MPAIEFITALGHLLSDGALRDALAADPRGVADRLNALGDDRVALEQLVAEDLEFQAGVLIRKRFEIIRRILPETCGLLAAQAWPLFHAYARASRPSPELAAVRDAQSFCTHIEQHRPDCLRKAEWNRIRFALSKRRFAIHFIRHWSRRGQNKRALQLFLRFGKQRWREATFYLSA